MHCNLVIPPFFLQEFLAIHLVSLPMKSKSVVCGTLDMPNSPAFSCPCFAAVMKGLLVAISALQLFNNLHNTIIEAFEFNCRHIIILVYTLTLDVPFKNT